MPLDQLVGLELASVTFVRDSVQLGFDGPTLNILTPLVVTVGNVAVASGDDDFRNRICELIGKQLSEVQVRMGDALRIGYIDGSSVSVSLRAEDYSGAEAVIFYSGSGECVVF